MDLIIFSTFAIFQPHYDCLCEDGWTKSADASRPTCTVDEDECVMGTHMCSRHPIVRCINTPGSYQCGLCPAGMYAMYAIIRTKQIYSSRTLWSVIAI